MVRILAHACVRARAYSRPRLCMGRRRTLEAAQCRVGPVSRAALVGRRVQLTRKVTIMCMLQIDKKDDGVDVATVIQVLAAAQPVSRDVLALTSVRVRDARVRGRADAPQMRMSSLCEAHKPRGKGLRVAKRCGVALTSECVRDAK